MNQLIMLLILFVIPGVVLIVIFSIRAGRSHVPPQQNTIIDDIPEPASPVTSNVDQLLALNKLRESGVLTEEEFEKEKKRILG